LNTALQTILDALPTVSESESDYQEWVVKTALTQQDEQAIMAALERLPKPGQTSAGLTQLDVIIAGENDPSKLLASLDALSKQLWTGFGVTIASPAHALSTLRQAIEAFFPHGTDFTLRLIPVDAPVDDVFALEAAALRASGADYVSFLARGDIVPRHATAEIALALARQPETYLLFTDEDWIDAHGNRSRPRFKAGWDPDAQLGFDLIGRFSPMKREIALEAGGLRKEAGLAAHYALHCRVAGLAGPLRILHLPSVLRHAAKQTVASVEAANAYAASARLVAEEAALLWEGIIVAAEPAPLSPWLNRIRWPMPAKAPLVSILLPTRDHPKLLEAAARGVLEETDYPSIEVLVLDNGSVEPETTQLFRRLAIDPRVRILPMPGPFNYSKLNNDGAAAARGEILLLLNNDIEMIGSDWLREMVSLAVRPEIGCVGAKLLYADGRIQHAGINMAPHTGCAHVGRLFERAAPGDAGMLAITRTHSAVTAACLGIRTEVFKEVGGLDEDALRVGYNDVDLCLKVRDYGYRSVDCPSALLFHMESVSRGPNDNPEKRAREKAENARIVGRWRELFLDDPYQNPNTLLTWEGKPRLVASRRTREWEYLS
jgi:GT2 family glycosyltransferase